MCKLCSLKLKKSSEVVLQLFCCFPVSKKVRRSEKTHFLKRLMSAQTSRVLMSARAQREMLSESDDLRVDKKLVEVPAHDVRKSKQMVNMSEKLTKMSEK